MFDIFHVNVPYMRRLILGFSPSYRSIRLTQCRTQLFKEFPYQLNVNATFKIATTLKIGSKECRVCAFYLPRFKINLIKFINAQINCYCDLSA